VQLSGDHTRWRLKRKFLRSGGNFVRVSRKAARTVAAHLSFTTVAIVIPHPKIGAVRCLFEQKNPICADTVMPIANPHDLFGIQTHITGAIVDHDEIVAGAIHFSETQHVVRLL